MINFDDMPTVEPSSLIGFAQNRLVRDAEHRDEKSLATALTDPRVRFHLILKGRVLVLKDDNKRAVFSREEILAFGPKPESAVLLGETEAGPLVAMTGTLDPEALVEPLASYDLRSLLYASGIDDETASTAGHAASLLYWHRTNRFCARCGEPSKMAIGGYRRDCTACDSRLFPRTDPVVIMLPINGERCVMGRSPHFPEGWYSTLAGFLEYGETIEQAVRRETFEESGIEIGRVKYFASQPWPFPHSLMIGIHCEAVSETVNFDKQELEDCRWFDREEVKLMIREEHPDGLKCPPTRAISSAIIRAWAGV